MLPTIEKIIHRTKDKIYFKFKDGAVMVLDLKTTIEDMPDWQINIVVDKWEKAKVGEFGCLQFNTMLDIGGDSVYHLSKELSNKELFEIIESKRIAKKRIMQTLASLL